MCICSEACDALLRSPLLPQDKLREYEKQIQELTAKLNAAEKEKSSYELKCGEMEKVNVCM